MKKGKKFTVRITKAVFKYDWWASEFQGGGIDWWFEDPVEGEVEFEDNVVRKFTVRRRKRRYFKSTTSCLLYTSRCV